MKILRPAFAAFSLLIGHSALAEQQFTFAIPETTGLISLGAFDSQGRLVSTVSEAESTTAFQPDLNGLRTAWSGVDKSGQPYPDGDYEIKGWLVSDAVKVEGHAFRFNDWVQDEDSPRLHRVEAIIAMKGNAFAVFAQDGSKEPGLWIQEGEDEPLGKKIPLPEGASFLAATPTTAVFAISKGLLVAPLDGSAALDIAVQISPSAPTALSDDALVLAAEDKGQPVLQKLSLKDGAVIETVPTPAKFSRLTAIKNSVAGSDGRKVWLLEGKEFREIPLGDSPEVLGLSPGPGDTFWLLTRADEPKDGSPALLRQYDLKGELLREFAPGSQAGETRAFTDAADLRIFLTNTRASEQTAKGLHPTQPENDPPQDEVAQVVDWEVFLDKTITNCTAFGVKDGQLVADAGSTPAEASIKVHLAPSRLEQQPDSVTLKAVGGSDGIWLQDPQGLRLLRIAEIANPTRIVVYRGAQPDDAIIAVGDDGVVAEYQVSGLRKIFALDAGTIHLP